MDNQENGKPPKVGFKSPPKHSQFKRGESGNKKGRPPKLQRSFTPRQHRADVFSITEAPTRILTADGEVVVPAIVAVLRVAMSKALKAHGPSIRLVLSKHFEALTDHYREHAEYFSQLESLEKYNNFGREDHAARESAKLINHLRKHTRKI